MPQGLRSCGCPARWCSCGGTINKSELRTKTKAVIVRKVTVPPSIHPEGDANFSKKAAPIPEGLKKKHSIGKSASKLLKKSEESAKPVKEAVLKRGRSKTLGLENAEKVVETEASPEVVENALVKRPEHEVHRSKKAKVEDCAPEILESSVENRAEENGVVQVQGKLHADVLEKDARSRQVGLPVSAGKLRSRIKSQIRRVRREEALLEAYGGSGEKLRPEKELLRARGQIQRSKLAIRGAIHELEIIMRHGGSVEGQKGTGHLDHEEIACAVCQSGHVTPSNDILLCDGACNRGFHQYCLDPAVTSDKIPGVEESWLCPACDVKLDCIHAINKQFGTGLLLTSTWQDVFPVEAEQNAAGSVPVAPEEAEWPSDDSADEDFDPDAEAYRKAEGNMDSEMGGARGSMHGEGEAAGQESDESDDDIDDDVSDGEAKALLEQAGADAASGLSNEVEEKPEDLIIEGKRRRTPVDYKILNFALFGFDDVTDDSDEDMGLSRKKHRTKNGLEEPIFTTDVTGAPQIKPDVSTQFKAGPAPVVKPQVEAEVVVGKAETGAPGEAEIVENGDQVSETKGEDELGTETKAETDSDAKQNGKPASAEDAVRAPSRASKYQPELEDAAYDVLKSSFLENQVPTLERKQELSEQLKLPFDQVNRWFRGYRHKVLTALDRPPDQEPIPSRPAGSKYPLPSASEIAAEEAAERDRRLNMVLASTGKLRAALERAAELRQVARENGEESSEADSPRWTETGGKTEPPGILAKLKQKGVGEFAVKKGKRTGYGSGEDRKNSEAHALQNTLKRLAALDTRPLSVNGNRMGRPPIRMIELMAEVECLHGGPIPELLAKRQGLKSVKASGRPPTLLQQSLVRGRRELGRGDDDSQGLVGSEGSGSWNSGRSSQQDPTAAGGCAVEIVRPRIGRPPKVLNEEPGLWRGASLNSNQSFDEDESGLEDSWVAALDKRPFSKNGKRMGRPSRQVKEAILQYRKEKQAAAEASGRDGGGSVGPGESTEEPARAYEEAPPVFDGPLPRFSKSGKRIGRPPRAIRKTEAESAAMVQAVHTAEPLHRSDSFGSLDGLVTGPDGVRYSKSGRRIGKPQRLGVVDCDELLQKQEEEPVFMTGPSKRMTSYLGSFDDLTAAIDHLEKPTVKVPRRERSADPLFDERAILSGIRARVASSNKLSAGATSSGNDVTGRNSGGAAGQEVQSPAPGVNGRSEGVVHRSNDPLESLFTVAAAHELEEKGTDGVEARKEAFDVEHLLMVVTNAGLANPAGLMDQPEFKAEVEMSKGSVKEPVKVSEDPDGFADVQKTNEQDVQEAGHDVGKSGGHLDAPASGPMSFESNFGSSGNLVAIAASLLSPVRRPDRPPRKGGKRAFSSLARVGSVPGLATMGLTTQSSSGGPSEGMSV